MENRTHVYGDAAAVEENAPTPEVVQAETVEEAPAEEPQVQKEPVPWFSREPVMVMAVVQAALALAMGFGLDISLEQMGLVLGFTAAVLALITRQQVTPFVSAGTTPNVNNPNNTPQVG